MKIYDFNGFPETHKAYGGMAGKTIYALSKVLGITMEEFIKLETE